MASQGSREDQTRWAQAVSVLHLARTGAKDTDPERDTIVWYQDFEKNQKARRRLCSRKKVSHPGE